MSDPMPGKPADFIVRLDGLGLSDEARNHIAAALQSATLARLGRLDLGHKTSAAAFIPRKEWYGFWLRSLADVRDLKGQDFNKALNVSERGL